MEARARFVSPLERALYLKTLERALEPTEELSPAELAAIADRARERFFSKGATVFRKGEPVGCFHIVVEGRLRARGGGHGERVVGPEETLGLLSLLSGRQEGLEAIADVDTLTLELDGDALQDLFEDHFHLVLYQIRSLARRMLSMRREIPDGAYLAPAEGVLSVPGERLDLIERLLYLTRGGTFQRGNLDAMVEMARQTSELRFEAGTRLWGRGDPSGFMLLLVDGTVRCRIDDHRSFRCGTGYPLGNLESQAGASRWYDAVTETRVVALRADMDAFVDLLEDHLEMAMSVLAGNASGVIRILEEQRQVRTRTA